MKKSIYGLSFLLVIAIHLNARLPFSHIISFFVQTAPFSSEEEDVAQKFNKTITTLGKAACKIACSVIASPHHGIFATYGGYMTISNINGQITFPLMQQSKKFLLIITEKIGPVFMIGNTIHHWKLLNIPHITYSVERKQDQQTKLYYWDVEATPNPENNIIPLNSIVIFAKPKNIIVPTGISLTNDDPQLLLPTIYVTKNNNNIVPALSTLTVRQFFGPLSITNKKENNTYYSTQIITTQ